MKFINLFITISCLFFTTIFCDESVTSSSVTTSDGNEKSVNADESESSKKKVKVKRTKKSTRDWDKLSENDLEKDWEKGDDEFELEHEFERIQRIQSKKSQKMSNILDSNDPAQIAKLIQSGGLEQKGGMFFITLKDKQPDGSDWTTAAQDKLASYWSALLRTNSLSGNVFNLEPGQLLVSVDKGWLMKEVMDFVLSREEVVKITKDNKDHFPKSVDSDDEL